MRRRLIAMASHARRAQAMTLGPTNTLKETGIVFLRSSRIHLRFVMLVALSLAASCNRAPSPAGDAGDGNPPPPPPNGEFELVVGDEPYGPPDISIPAKAQPFGDPSFHTTAVRVTEQAVDGYIGPGIQNEYSKKEAGAAGWFTWFAFSSGLVA